jgi:NADH-ubiquinone oxidoreductase chain 2
MILLFIFFQLLFNAVSIRRDLYILFNRTAIIGLISFFFLGFQSFILANKGLGLQSGLIFTNNIAQFLHQIIFFLCILMLQCTSFYPRKLNDMKFTTNKLLSFQMKVLDKLGEQFKIIEYPLILLFVITGATLLISTNDLISIFLCIELQSYGLYLISTIYRNSELATTSGLIYFLIGGLSSCFILLSVSLLYTNSGASGLDALFMINNMTETNNIYI